MWCFSSSPHLTVKGILPLAIFAFVQGLLTWGFCFIVHSWPLITTYIKQDMDGMIEIYLKWKSWRTSYWRHISSRKKKASINERDWRSAKVKLTVGLASLTLNKVLVLYSDWYTGSSFSEACKSHIALSVYTVDVYNKVLCHSSITMETPISYCSQSLIKHTFRKRDLYVTSTYSCVKGSYI